MREKRRGLGRGLGALIPTSPEGARPVDVFFPAASGDGRAADGAVATIDRPLVDGAVDESLTTDGTPAENAAADAPAVDERGADDTVTAPDVAEVRFESGEDLRSGTENAATGTENAATGTEGASAGVATDGDRDQSPDARPGSAESDIATEDDDAARAFEPATPNPVAEASGEAADLPPAAEQGADNVAGLVDVSRETESSAAATDASSGDVASSISALGDGTVGAADDSVRTDHGADADEAPQDDATSSEAVVEGVDPAGDDDSSDASERVDHPVDARERGTLDAEPAEGLVPVPGATFAELPVDSIRPNPRQPRSVFDEGELDELVGSIKEIGVLQPVVVRPDAAEPGRYELIMGERRWRATQAAGLTVIPAIVRVTDDEAMLRDALLENLHRSALNPLEEAAAYRQLLDDFGCTHDELAARISRSRPQISNTLRLLRLPPLVQRRVAAGVLSAGHARALLGLSDGAAIERLAQRVVAEGLSVRATEEIVSLGGLDEKPRQARPRAGQRSEAIDALATRLSDRFETRVRVDLGKSKGRVTIEFASVEDLNRILDVMAPTDPGLLRA